MFGQDNILPARTGVAIKRPLLILAAACLPLLSACTALGPDFVTPDAPIQKTWQEQTALARDGEVDLYKWWAVLDDPILNQLIEAAYKQNLSIQVAGLRVIEARAQLGIATGSQYPQRQRIVGAAEHVNLSENAPNFNPTLEDSYNQYAIGFDAAWELDFWGRYRRGIESAEAGLKASVADYDDALVTITAEVARVYVSIRTLQERLRLARNNVKLQTRSLEIATVRFENGLVTELDKQQARSNLAETQASIPALERSIRQARNSLSVLLGITPGQLNEVLTGAGKIPAPPAEVVAGVPTDLLRRRPDVRRAEQVAASQSALIGVAKADLYPSFSLVGTIGYQSSNTHQSSGSDLFDSDSVSGSIGPGLSWNIFNYGRIKNNVRSQDARFQQTLVAYQNTVLKAYQETEDAMVAYIKSQQEVIYRQTGAEAATRSARLARLQYRDGAIDFQRVIDAERFMVAQQDRLASTQGDIVLNLIAMYKALGGGWQGHDVTVSEKSLESMKQRVDWGDLLTTPQAAEKSPDSSKQQ